MIVKAAGSSGSGRSSLLRYMAEDGLAPEIEGEGPRDLFTRDEGSLTRLEAEVFLGRDDDPVRSDDLVHLIVSLSPEEYEALGDNEAERQEALRTLGRAAARELGDARGSGELRFAGAVHRNTENPHVHLAIARDGEKGRLAEIPHAFWQSSRADGESTFKDRVSERLEELRHPPERVSVEIGGRGLVARDVVGREGATRDEALVGRWLAAESALSADPKAAADRKLWALRRAVEALDAGSSTRGEFPTAAAIARPDLQKMLDDRELRSVAVPASHREQLAGERAERLEAARRALGASERAALELTHARYLYERIADNGERLRYGAGQLPTSLRDQARLAEAESYRVAESRNPRTSEERDEILQASYSASLAEFAGTASFISIKHQKHVERVRVNSVKAKETADSLHSAAEAAKDLYGPELRSLIGDDVRLELENQAAERGDPDALATLDLGRESPRDDAAWGRLLAWKELGEASVRQARDRLESFERDRHTRRVDVEGRHWSLAVLDRDAERQTREGEFLRGRLSLVERKALDRYGQGDWVSRTLESLVRPRGEQLKVPGKLGELLDRMTAMSSRPAKLDVPAFERALAVREEQRTIERARSAVVEALASERREHARDVAEAQRFVRVVDGAIQRDTSEYRTGAPAFEPYEVRRLERDAARSRDVGLFERAVELADTIAETPTVAHARALARELDSRVSVEAARERLERHDRFRDSVPVDVDGSIHRLRQVAPQVMRPEWSVRVPHARSGFERLLGTEVRFDLHVSPKALRQTVFKSVEDRELERRIRAGLDEIRTRHARELDDAGRVHEAAIRHVGRTSGDARAGTKPIFSIDEIHRLQVYGVGGANEPLRSFVRSEVRSAIDEKRWERSETWRAGEEKQRSRDAGDAPEREREAKASTSLEPEPAAPAAAKESGRDADPLPPRSKGEDLSRGQLVALARVLGPVVDVGVRRPNGKMRELTADVAALDRHIGYLRHENAHGADIFIRPHESTGVVLMDDVSRAKLKELRRDGVQPAAVVESSPGNFQVWVRLSRQEVPQAIASAVGRDLAAEYGTDARGVAWNHFGRCPGFTNRKPSRATERGAPFAKLHEASDRVADRGPELIREAEMRLAAPAPLPAREISAPGRQIDAADREADPKASYERIASRVAPDIARDTSRVDFRVAVKLSNEGRDRSFIREAIERGSPGLGQRRKSEGYVDRTIDRAAEFLSRLRERGPERSR